MLHEVSPKVGHFIQPQNNQMDIVSVAGGIRITPCLGLMNNLPKETCGMLIWSLHSEKDLVFKNELSNLSKSHPNIKIVVQYSETEGHLTQIKLKQIAQEYLNNKIEWYVCGPPRMMSSIKKILNHLHISNVYEEGFIF